MYNAIYTYYTFRSFRVPCILNTVIAGDENGNGMQWEWRCGKNWNGNVILDWEWELDGNDSTGMVGTNNNSHSRIPLL